jgi:hypothetical protein
MRPTAQALPSPSPSPSASPLASPTPSPETSPTAKAMLAPSPTPTPSPTPGANDPSLGRDGFTVPAYTFTVSKNVVFSVVLPGHATEGYKWVLATGFDLKVASGTGQSRPGPKAAGAANGVSAAQVFDFTAVGTGQTTLSFDLVMPSDAQKASVENRKFSVNVL